MKILVINGSPKGDYSTTLQSCLYIQKHNPGQSFEFINAGSRIKSIEKDFSPVAKSIEEADLLLFSYPVYTFIAPSQLHRFIELMKDAGLNLNRKYATQITTSKHFYDVTAHAYIQENCQDMGLKFIRGLSADMDDLLTDKGQKEALDFFRYVEWCVENNIYEAFPEKAGAAKRIAPSPAEAVEKKEKTVAIVADLAPDDAQLASMIESFRRRLPLETKLVNIHDFEFKGGCISCFNCAVDGTCIYKDGFSDLLRNEIQTCSAIVIAFTIKDHSMGSRFKTYDDRQFCNGHRTVTMGMPFGYIISGNYPSERNLQMIIDGRAEVGGNFLAGIANDQSDPDLEIEMLCKRLSYAVENSYVQPSNFLGVGGMKIFRDLIWLMQGFMKADHKFYAKHNQYDFPQKQWPTMLKMYLVGALISNPEVKKKMGSKMNEGMISPYKKVLKK